MLDYFVKHPTAANILMCLIMVAGILSVSDLKRETFPDFKSQKVEVSLLYPGASSSEVDEAICQRMSEALEGITSLKEVRCESRQGKATAIAEMDEKGDFSTFMDDVKTEVESITEFPENTESLTVKVKERSDFVASVVISGSMSPLHLKLYAEEFKRTLLNSPQIAQVVVKGFSKRQLQVEVSKLTLRQFGLSAEDISQAIQAQSIRMPVGEIQSVNQNILLQFNDERRTPQELAEIIIISGENGAEVPLGEIAIITDSFEREEDKILYNGQRAAVLEIMKSKKDDSLIVFQTVESIMKQEKHKMPESLVLKISQDMTSIVKDRLSMLVENSIQGLILVLLVMCLFFPLRYAFWVALGLPVSFLGTLCCMVWLGYSINMITMVGLLMAIGLLMDDSIVIAENIAAHLQANGKKIESVVNGLKEVMGGVFSSFLTTVCIFGPLAFMSGDIGKVLKVLPVVLMLTLMVSLVEVFLILPHHLSHGYNGNNQLASWRLVFEEKFDMFRNHSLKSVVQKVLNHRALFVIGIVFFSGLTVVLIANRVIKFEVFPSLEGDVIEAQLLMPQGTTLDKTEQYINTILGSLNQVNAKYKELDQQNPFLVKSYQVRFNQNKSVGEVGAHVATVIVDVLDSEQRKLTLDEIMEQWRNALPDLPDMINLLIKQPAMGPGGKAIELRLQSKSIDDLKAVSMKLQQRLSESPGVYHIMDDLRPGKTELRLRIGEGASTLGLTAMDIAFQVKAAFLGEVISDIQYQTENFEIKFKQAFVDRDSLDDLENFSINLKDGSQVPLSSVAEVQSQRGWSVIKQVNGIKTLTVQADVNVLVANAIEIVMDIKKELLPKLLAQYPGLSVSIEGQIKKGNETGSSIWKGFLLGLISVFAILSYQFRNYSDPFAVMLVIPLAILGAIWGHYLVGFPISMPSVVGAASLAGIVVNDSILMITFIRKNLKQGLPLKQSAVQASSERFRAIVLSSLTTILGLLPLLLETSLQAQVLKPLVISMVFGLLSSTILVLFVVPTFYSILQDCKEKFQIKTQ